MSSFPTEKCTHKVNGICVRVCKCLHTCEKNCSFLLLREKSTQVWIRHESATLFHDCQPPGVCHPRLEEPTIYANRTSSRTESILFHDISHHQVCHPRSITPPYDCHPTHSQVWIHSSHRNAIIISATWPTDWHPVEPPRIPQLPHKWYQPLPIPATNTAQANEQELLSLKNNATSRRMPKKRLPLAMTDTPSKGPTNPIIHPEFIWFVTSLVAFSTVARSKENACCIFSRKTCCNKLVLPGFTLGSSTVFLCYPSTREINEPHRTNPDCVDTALAATSLCPRILSYTLYGWRPQFGSDQRKVSCFLLAVGKLCHTGGSPFVRKHIIWIPG